MNITNIKYFCTTNGDGFRTAVFVAGCHIHCKGCFNKAAWDFNTGKILDEEMIDKILTSIEPENIEGLSILGGEPLDPDNQEGVAKLIREFRHRFGMRKNIWLWTGYILNNVPDTQYIKYIKDSVDYIIDGPYIESLYNADLKYRGSSNQRIIKI